MGSPSRWHGLLALAKKRRERADGILEPCPKCHSTGGSYKRPCKRCGGAGSIYFYTDDQISRFRQLGVMW